MRQDDLLIYRRRLPHWRLAGSTYFVTWRLASTQSELSPKERDLVVAALRHFEGERYELLAYVVMHDHIHLLATPLETYRLQEIVHSWKSFTANSLQRTSGRRGAVWQDEYYDRIVRDEEELLEKVNYILTNPSRSWPDIEDYAWARCLLEGGHGGPPHHSKRDALTDPSQ